MRRECRELFPRHRGLAIAGCITARASRTCRDASRDRYLGISFEVGGGGNVPGIPGACATRNFTYLARGPCRPTVTWTLVTDLTCVLMKYTFFSMKGLFNVVCKIAAILFRARVSSGSDIYIVAVMGDSSVIDDSWQTSHYTWGFDMWRFWSWPRLPGPITGPLWREPPITGRFSWQNAGDATLSVTIPTLALVC